MTVKELINKLGQFNPDSTVAYRVPAKDYCETQLAYDVGTVANTEIKWSDNHRENQIVTDEDETDEIKNVVLLDI